MEKSSSIYSNPNQFHSGIIDVFKEFHVNDNNSKHYKRKGDIQHKMSTDIGKKVVFINGSLSASNFIEVPNPELKKVFNYTSTYYYVQFKCSEDSKFSFQLNFMLSIGFYDNFNGYLISHNPILFVNLKLHKLTP